MKKRMIWLTICAMLLAATACSNTKDDSKQDSSTASGKDSVTTAPKSDATTTTTTVTTIPPEPPKPTVDANAITFEDGDLWTAHSMNEKEYKNDESNVKLSVEALNGTKQLRIQVLDKDEKTGMYKVPKVVFDMAKLVGTDNQAKIKKISCDFTSKAVGLFTGDDGEEMMVPGNAMGGLCGNLAGEKKKADADGKGAQNTWATFEEYAFECWDWDWGYEHFETEILLDANRYAAGYESTTFVVMRWGIPNQADLYIDNITFYDEDGKSIPLIYKPA